jgi:hypothetical protein
MINMLASKVVKVGILAAFIAAIFLTYTHAQDLEDWMRLRNYHPSSSISAFVTEDTMTPYASHIFYVTHPTLESNVTLFRQECSNAEQTIVLGCYRSGVTTDSNLFIYNVADPRLNGVQQVTAAHEMLHAAYARLGQKDKDKIDAMLTDFYNNQLTDQRIKDTINSYKKTEPTELVNEMHSIFGTEVVNLPPPLEDYYKQYFTNRGAIVAFAASYEGEFTSRTAQIDADDAQLADLKSQIQLEEQALRDQLASLQADRSRIESSNSQADINSYNARVAAYNAGIQRLQDDIASYNALVEERNSIAAELKSLQGSLDTRLTAQQAQ